MDKTQADLDLYFLTRNVQWRYRLDQYEDATIAEMLKTVRTTVAEIKREIFDGDAPKNADALVAELEALSAGLRKRIGEDVAIMSSVAGEYSVAEHTAIMSLDGAVKINTVALSAAQFKEFLGGPTHGTPLPAWVDAAWGKAVSEKIRRNLNVAVLRGEGYQKAVRGLLDAGLADFTEREAITIARTYVQTANVAAQMAVYQANDDLVKGWKWSAVLEPGYAKSGRGTCLRCAALDQREFKMGEGPPIPLHPRCRCVAIPVTKTWRELGIDRDEVEAAVRPYTIRPDANIDAGGMRTIIESGRHQGNYASWFEKQPEAFKINAVGPGRYELLKSGKIKFEDLVDDMGNSRTIAQLKGLKGGVGGVGGVNFVSGVAVREQIESAAYKIMEEVKDRQADNAYIERFMKAHGLTLDDYKKVNDALYKHNISSGPESDTLLSSVWNSTEPDGKAMRLMSRWHEWQARYEASRSDEREIAKNILATIKKQGITEGDSYKKFAKYRTFGHVCSTLERAEKYLNAVINGEPVVFRKGGLDHAALSTTKNISGATSGTSKFVPDRFFTLSELADEGYYPVSGYRGLVSLTSGAEEEVIFLKPLPR